MERTDTQWNLLLRELSVSNSALKILAEHYLKATSDRLINGKEPSWAQVEACILIYKHEARESSEVP